MTDDEVSKRSSTSPIRKVCPSFKVASEISPAGKRAVGREQVAHDQFSPRSRTSQ